MEQQTELLPDDQTSQLGSAITGMASTVRAAAAGTPVLARRLTQPLSKRREAAAAERARIEKERAKALAKISDDDAREKAQVAYTKQDQVAAKARRKAATDNAWTVGIVLFIGGPLTWHYVRPLLPWLVAGGIGLWTVLAIIHAPAATPQKQPADSQAPAAGEGERSPEADAAENGEWIQESPAPEVLWALIRHTAGLTRQGTAAHLSEILTEGQRRGEFDGWNLADLGDELAALGVRVVEGKKLTVRGKDYNRKAVLLADLPAAAGGTVPALLHKAPPGPSPATNRSDRQNPAGRVA